MDNILMEALRPETYLEEYVRQFNRGELDSANISLNSTKYSALEIKIVDGKMCVIYVNDVRKNYEVWCI